jgi:hypothetical protein
MSAQYVVGIDLGTTHCAMAVAPLTGSAGPSVFSVPQLIARGTVEARPLLPSFFYAAHSEEGALALPWDGTRTYSVGEHARSRGAEAPGRVVSSAKSWLSHTSVDRRSALLPIGAPEDVEKISPVEAAWRYLDHLAEAWQHTERASGLVLAEQEVVITVPASFDAAARDLTVEAAYAAGLENVTLLEEPQAALYSWICTHEATFHRELSPGDVVLVVDVGGGTTDFSAIAAVESDTAAHGGSGRLELVRVAVGDHILLGGDNMDLALAHAVREQLEARGAELDRWQLSALSHACRGAKERLLADDRLASAKVVVPARGSQLIGGAISAELTRSDVEARLLDGFFPNVAATEHPVFRPRTGLLQRGLPYASDPAITRHLAQFLTRQARATDALSGFRNASTAGSLLHPKWLLFNGGVVKAPSLRTRLLTTLNRWLESDGAAPVRLLSGEDPDLAVARGAAYFGLVRRGRGLLIRGGTARAYYVGIESPMPAVPGVEPPVTALCVAPFGMDEGSAAELPPHELGVVVGEPVRFRFFGSSVRRDDRAGTQLERWAAGELDELSPIEITFPSDGRHPGDVVPVHLQASVTAVGTLLIEAVPLAPLTRDERWKVELGVRGDAR